MGTERSGIGWQTVFILALFVPQFLLSGCSSTSINRATVAALEPLSYESQEFSVEAALQQQGDRRDLLALSPEMKSFADRYVRVASTSRQRLNMLHRSLRSSALVNIDYDPNADGTATDAFESGRANCLSYAHLFVAMARYSGLDARYQSLVLRPEWSRHGERVALRRHVNVVVRLPGGEQFMVDIDPVQPERVARVERLKDREAWALHENNLAMTYLFDDRVPQAWSSAVRALDASPRIDYLWVNLGAIYRQAGQDQAAERSYFNALEINSNSRSAMNNLAVLYEEQGKPEQAAHWDSQVSRHRQRNPYYHTLLGEKAEEAGDLPAALSHYQDALALRDTDAQLYFRVGKLYLALRQPDEGVRYLQLAIKHAHLVSERSEYQAFLDGLGADALASLAQPAGRTRM